MESTLGPGPLMIEGARSEAGSLSSRLLPASFGSGLSDLGPRSSSLHWGTYNIVCGFH